MMRLLTLMLFLGVAAQAQVTVLVSKNFRGNTLPGAYRQGGIVEVRPDRVDTVYTEIDSVTIDTSIVVTPHPIGTKEPTAFYILRVPDGVDSSFAAWLAVDNTSPPATRGRRLYRLRANYLNTLDTYDTLTFVDFTDKVIPKDQGWLHGYEEPQPERWAGIKLEVPLWIRRLMPAVATSATVNPDGGADYTSLNAAEAGEQKDLVTATETLTITCTSDGTADATAVAFVGWTTDATYNVTVNGENQSASTVGIWDASIYRISVAATPFVIDIGQSGMDINFNNLQVEPKHATLTSTGIGSSNTNTSVTITKSIFMSTAGNNTRAWECAGASGCTLTVKNSIAYDLVYGAVSGSNASNTMYVYNSTFDNISTGALYKGVNTTSLASNCVVQNSTDNFIAVSGSWSGDYNIEDDNDADTPGANSIKNTAVTFQDATNDDYRLTSASRGVDEGTDLSGSGVTDDITGYTRSGTYDMGAFEFFTGVFNDTFYVNPDATGEDHGRDSTNAFTSLSQAESKLVAADSIWIFCFSSGGTADATAVTFDGTGTGDYSSAIVEVNGENQSATTVGVWDASIYRLAIANLGSNVGVVENQITKLTLNNLQIDAGAASNLQYFGIKNTTASTNTYISNCILRNTLGVGSIGSFVGAVHISASGSTVEIRNTIIDNWNKSTFVSSAAINIGVGGGTINCYNTTINDGAAVGFRQAAGTFTTSNCIVQNFTDSYSGTFSGNYNMDDNGDASMPGANSITASATFTNEAGSDFSLVAGSRGIDEGTDLSGSGVTTAIDGTARPQGAAFDMGAFETLAGTFDRYVRLNSWYAYGATNRDTVVIGARGASGLAFIDSNIVYLTGTAANYTTDYLNALLLISFNIGGDSTLYWYDYANSDTVAMGSPAVTVQSTPFPTAQKAGWKRFKQWLRWKRWK